MRPEVDSPAVVFERAGCRLGQRDVLAGLTLSIARGRCTGVLGPNGAGKTTLLGLIVGLRSLSSGAAWVLGEPVGSRSAQLRRRIGVVLQETALYEELTVAENLRFAAALNGLVDSRRRVAEVLDLLGIAHRANALVRTLSGGTQRRVSIARALLHQPELLVVDEPTLGVDAETRHAIWSHLRQLRAGGTTVIVATNYLDEAQALCDSVAVIRDGQVVAFETPAALVARAGHCIDVECESASVTAVVASLDGVQEILRVAPTAVGVSVFVSGAASSEMIVHRLLGTGAISGFRVRAADLAEVFRALQDAA